MMTGKEYKPLPGDAHWTEDQMLARVYGLDAPSELKEAHLRGCPGCAARWAALEARRAHLLEAEAPVADTRLRAQRAAVFARLEERRPRGVWALAPAAATALLLVLGVALQAPAPVAPPQQSAAVISQADRELFTEIAALMEEDMPRATGAVRSLFEHDATPEVY